MKSFIASVFVIVFVCLLVAFTGGGCTSAPAWDQAQANAVAQTLGAGAVMAYNAKGDQLKPQEKQAASMAIYVFGMLGNNTGAPVVPDQAAINKIIADKIKDPTEAAAVQLVSQNFMALVSPQLTKATNSAGASAAGQVFVAFCKGLASVPLK